MPRTLSWEKLAIHPTPRGQVITPRMAEGPAVSVARMARVNRADEGSIRVFRRSPCFVVSLRYFRPYTQLLRRKA
jgi:hypothetical protein